MVEPWLEGVLRRERAIVITALIAITALAWSYVIWLVADMKTMDGMPMAGFRMIPAGVGLMAPARLPWSAFEFAFVYVMWVIMMVGMMLPSAAPMILIYARVGRQAVLQGKAFAAIGWFVAGYLLAWAAFSLIATVAQWALDRTALLDPRMVVTDSLLGGAVFIAAGIYQWMPLKDMCLKHCQGPLLFIQNHGGFRRDRGGSLRQGLHHGLYCVGCCWVIMALLFIGGVMNVLWIAAIAFFVFAEKAMPRRWMISRFAGVTSIATGAWLLVRSYL